MKKILLLNGPNLNLLGERETSVYGKVRLTDIVFKLKAIAEKQYLLLTSQQSNSEGALVDAIQKARNEQFNYMIINAAAYTHTSIAIRDALLAVEIPFIEVHISNIFQRETFRNRSLLSDIAEGCICGLGVIGYELALLAAMQKLKY